HLEQAVRYRQELGPGAARTAELATRASERLFSSAERALSRGDRPAATNMWGRGIRLLEPGSPARTRALPEPADTLYEDGPLARAPRAIDEGLAEARAAGDRAAEGRLEVLLQIYRLSTDPGSLQAAAADEIERIRGDLIELGDEAG